MFFELHSLPPLCRHTSHRIAHHVCSCILVNVKCMICSRQTKYNVCLQEKAYRYRILMMWCGGCDAAVVLHTKNNTMRYRKKLDCLTFLAWSVRWFVYIVVICNSFTYFLCFWETGWTCHVDFGRRRAFFQVENNNIVYKQPEQASRAQHSTLKVLHLWKNCKFAWVARQHG